MRLFIFCWAILCLFQIIQSGKSENNINRIVGGYPTEKDQLPYQVSLRIQNHHICGGAIISNQHVLTAAHCVMKGEDDDVDTVLPVNMFSIRIGSIYTDNGGELRDIRRILVHPDYKDYYNDIAILIVSEHFQFSKSVMAIPLAWQPPPAKANVLISGWGYTTENGSPSLTLKHNQLQVMSLEECNNIFAFVNSGILCLSHILDNGICDGDSGGPAVYQNRLVGIANFALGCGRSTPDGFADISHFLPWIVKNTDPSPPISMN